MADDGEPACNNLRIANPKQLGLRACDRMGVSCHVIPGCSEKLQELTTFSRPGQLNPKLMQAGFEAR